MSRVTNIIITASIGEDLDYLTEKFKEYHVNGLSFNLVSVDSDSLPRGWYGGSKMIEANIFVGAFNYLNLESLLLYLKGRINWSSPSTVQLIVKEQNDLRFRLINLFEE
jgi:hypothetical protein